VAAAHRLCDGRLGLAAIIFFIGVCGEAWCDIVWPRSEQIWGLRVTHALGSQGGALGHHGGADVVRVASPTVCGREVVACLYL
jgi:hypothetical protein